MCLWPRLIKNLKYTKTKKNGGVVPAVTDKRVLAVPIGCGQCIECMNQRSREWKVRLMEDIRTNDTVQYVTLTFSNESIKDLAADKKCTGLEGYELDNAIAKLAMRRFNERWRKKHKKALRHFCVTELGHNGTENIHMHGLLWTDKKEDIRSIWKYGWVDIGWYVNERTINYIGKYITKVDFDHKYYKPKILTSAGIGKNYINRLDAKLNEYKGEKTKETYKTRQGTDLALPIYYRNKIYTDEQREKLWIQKLDKEERYVLGKKIDISQGLEKYYAALEEARTKNNRLGYGNNEKNWSREKYEHRRRVMLQKKRIDNIKDSLPLGAKTELWGQSSAAHRGMKPQENFDSLYKGMTDEEWLDSIFTYT